MSRSAAAGSVLVIVSVASLFLSFFTNSFGVANEDWFANFQSDSESYVIGRLVKSRQDGILAAGGLPGLGSLTTVPVDYADNPFSDQYSAYANHYRFRAFTTYDSQIGGQGMLFGILDRVLAASPETKLRVFHGLTASISALVLSAIVLWFYFEFRSVVAVGVLLSIICSQWLVVFGRNLWWSLWAFYVPLGAVLYYLRPPARRRAVNLAALFGVVALGVFVKCVVNGYEYITTTIVMVLVPGVFYGAVERWPVRRWIQILSVSIAGACSAVVASMVLLCFQIASVRGRVAAGVSHIIYSFAKRTRGDPTRLPAEFGDSLRAGTAPVIARYLTGTYFLNMRYVYLIAVVIAMSLALYVRSRSAREEAIRRKEMALILATWVAFLGPVSWFVVFKAHSFIHTHMDFIVWQMPFVLFGGGTCGCVVADLLRWRPRGKSRAGSAVDGNPVKG